MKKTISVFRILIIIMLVALFAVSCERRPQKENETQATAGSTETSQTEATETTQGSDASETTETSEITETTETVDNTETTETTETTEESQTDCSHEWSAYRSNGNGHIRSCEKCGDEQQGEHSAMDAYSSDEINHWQACGECGEKLNLAEHTATLEQTGSKKHSVVCEVCDVTIAKQDHAFACVNVREAHVCECGATQECPAVSESYLHSDSEHWVASCEICGIQDAREEHAWIYIPSSRHCDICGYEQVCEDDHLLFDAQGHWVGEECEICRISLDTEKTPHTEKSRAVVTDDGQIKTVRICCGDCMYSTHVTTVPSSVNYYSSPAQIVNNWNCDSQSNSSENLVGTIVKEGDRLYSRVVLYQGASLEFAFDAYARGYAADQTINGGSGKYIVIRMRTHNVGFISVMLNSDKSSVANDASINPGAQEYLLVRGNRHLIQDEWQTYVIDIEQLNCPNYPADDKSVKSISFGLFFNGHAGDGTEYVDVEYAAICDDWSEIEAVVGEGEKVVYTKWTDNNLDVAKTSGGQTLEGVCLGECKPTLVIEGNTYIYKCSNASCSNVMEIKTVNVGQDGVNYYNPAGQQYNNYHVTNTTLKYDAQHGFVYNSISLDISGSISFSNGNIITLKDTVYGGGKYFVFKVRAGESTVQMKLAAYDKTGTVISNAGLADPLFETNTRSQVNTEWVVYVIDATEMLNSATKYYTTEDAGNKLATFGYKIANGSVGTVDIAYFAVCDNWKEIDSVVGSDDVILTNWESPASDLLVTSAEIDVRANME